MHGKILDTNKNILPGANVIIAGTKYGVNSNEAGEYLFDQIPTGKLKVQASILPPSVLTVKWVLIPAGMEMELPHLQLI